MSLDLSNSMWPSFPSAATAESSKIVLVRHFILSLLSIRTVDKMRRRISCNVSIVENNFWIWTHGGILTFVVEVRLHSFPVHIKTIRQVRLPKNIRLGIHPTPSNLSRALPISVALPCQCGEAIQCLFVDSSSAADAWNDYFCLCTTPTHTIQLSDNFAWVLTVTPISIDPATNTKFNPCCA